MKIKTKILQDMIAKAIKGASNNKMIPITSLIGIELKDNKLTLMTTDGSNHLRIIQNLENEIQDINQNFYAIVNADTFSKLVGKTTSDYIKLTDKENYLEFEGNGICKFDIAQNEDGDKIKFLDIENIPENNNSFKLSVNNLKTNLSIAKVSIAETMEIPVLTGYYIGEKIISTDTQKICSIENNLGIDNTELIDNPILISSSTAELLQLLDRDTVTLIKYDNVIIFKTDSILIYGKQLNQIENYPIQPVLQLINTEFTNYITFKKQDILNTLERMSLFITEYDKNSAYLNITSEGLQVNSQKSNASEIIPISHLAENFKSFKCLVDIEMLKSQIQVNLNDEITLFYGNEKFIAIKEQDTIKIMALSQVN